LPVHRDKLVPATILPWSFYQGGAYPSIGESIASPCNFCRNDGTQQRATSRFAARRARLRASPNADLDPVPVLDPDADPDPDVDRDLLFLLWLARVAALTANAFAHLFLLPGGRDAD